MFPIVALVTYTKNEGSVADPAFDLFNMVMLPIFCSTGIFSLSVGLLFAIVGQSIVEPRKKAGSFLVYYFEIFPLTFVILPPLIASRLYRLGACGISLGYICGSRICWHVIPEHMSAP